MVDDGPLQEAIDTAWSVYRAGIAKLMLRTAVAVCSNAICIGEGKRAGGDADEITAYGIAYLEWLREEEC
jgi:hypothetical protein